MDHHCVFFSKCIGGGNIYFFWGTIGGVLFNFLNIALMIGVTAAMNEGSVKDVIKSSGPGQVLNKSFQAAVNNSIGIWYIKNNN